MKKTLSVVVTLIILVGAVRAQFIAIDPSERCINARVIGLGRSFVGLADDTSAIYLNPAGLAQQKKWEITTLSGKFLEDYSYLSFSGYYPTPYGTFGLGFGGYSIAGAYATKVVEGSDPQDPIYEIDFTQPQIQNSNYVYHLSYGTGLDRFLKRFGWEDKVSLGGSLKLFNVGLSGDLITEGSATGMQLDLGMIYRVNDWLSLGGMLQNGLPGSLGGVLTYASGHKEGYPHYLKVGGAVKLMGPKGALLRNNQEVALLADMDYQLLVSKTLPVYRLGAEWSPIPMIAIRAGIDQAIEGDGSGQKVQTVNNIAAGVGLKYGGFKFDYGYHSFVTLPGVANHFFSLSYGVAPAVAAEIKEKLVLDEPKDKMITFSSEVRAVGNVLDPSARSLRIKGSQVKFGLKGEFAASVSLETGKNSLEAVIYDEKGKALETKKVRILRLLTFPDVAADYWVAEPISLLAMQKIITGYPDGTFKPEGNITRAEMCSLLMKSRPKTEDQRPKTMFKDVSAKHWAAAYIAQAAAEGVVKGYPGNLFKPNGKITRAEGLAMIARFAGISEEAYQNEFADITSSHWAAGTIAGSYKAGLLEYLKGKKFEPNKLLTRAETVEMLYRTRVVKEILEKDLLNWEGY